MSFILTFILRRSPVPAYDSELTDDDIIKAFEKVGFRINQTGQNCCPRRSQPAQAKADVNDKTAHGGKLGQI